MQDFDQLSSLITKFQNQKLPPPPPPPPTHTHNACKGLETTQVNQRSLFLFEQSAKRETETKYSSKTS